MTKRILVTGGLGFIGSHLVRELLGDADTQVTVVDDLSGTALRPEKIIKQITEDRPGQLAVRYLPLEGLAERPGTSFDAIYHLASIVGPAAVLKRSGFIAESIVKDAYVAIRLAQRCGARLINVSTSEVYGGGANGLCREDSPRVIRGTASARQEYAAGKLAVEVAVDNLCQQGKLDAVTIRPFNVAGVRQSGRGGFVLPRFIGQAILEQPLTVFGDGSQVRAFTDARDVAAGMVFAARHGGSGRVYNVGNPASRTSMENLADRVIEITGSSSSKQHIDPRDLYGKSYAGAPDKFPDAGELMTLGWQPAYTLEDTIRDTYLFMRELPEDELVTLSGLTSERTREPVPA